MVLTSDDRWLVMFVNPGEVLVRDKTYQDVIIYDKINHIYNSSLKNKSSSHRYNKHRSKSSLSSNSSYSKSDDETLATLDENKCDDNMTKSDGEDSGNKEIVDYRKLFLENIHNAARRNKEKEIEAHVQAFKEEMRERHHHYHKRFGPYDDEDNKYNKSPSKTSTTSTTHSNTNTPPSSSPSRHSPNKLHHKDGGNIDNKPLRSRSRSRTHSPLHSPRSPSSDNNEEPNIGNKSSQSQTQIINVLNSLNLSKLNGFNHHNGITIDMNTSNYGKHLKQILNSCKLHSQNQMIYNKNINEQSSSSEYKDGTILNINYHHHHTTMNGKIIHNNDDYKLSMNGEYPILFPLSYASPSPSISPMITPSPSPLDISNELNDEPQQLKHAKSQPIPTNHRINNQYDHQPLFNNPSLQS